MHNIEQNASSHSDKGSFFSVSLFQHMTEEEPGKVQYKWST